MKLTWNESYSLIDYFEMMKNDIENLSKVIEILLTSIENTKESIKPHLNDVEREKYKQRVEHLKKYSRTIIESSKNG